MNKPDVTLMNKPDGESKGIKRFIIKALEVGAPVAAATFAIFYDRVVKPFTTEQLITLIIAIIVLAIVTSAAAGWFYSQPRDLLNDLKRSIDQYGREGDQLQFELKTILGTALESQPYVDEDALSIIESNASNIWVISTDLRNDVTPGRIREAVEANLKNGKQYTYFVPSQTNPNFPDAPLNERAYKKWEIYLAYRDRVRFIHLPDDTLFLFQEIIIYNPMTDPNKNESSAPKGFTYFETSPDSRDRLMRIPDGYLQFLKGQLNRFSEGTGLDSDLERLIPELRNRLATADLGYLASLFGQRRIEDRQEFKKFLASVGQRDRDAATILEKALGRYVE